MPTDELILWEKNENLNHSNLGSPLNILETEMPSLQLLPESSKKINHYCLEHNGPSLVSLITSSRLNYDLLSMQ